jgi:hypothetical protein
VLLTVQNVKSYISGYITLVTPLSITLFRLVHLGSTYLKSIEMEELDGPAVSALWRAIMEVKQRWSVIGRVTKNLLSRTPPCFRTHIVRWSRLHLQSGPPALGPRASPCWPFVCGPFSLLVIHKEGLCLSGGDINRLMMI